MTNRNQGRTTSNANAPHVFQESRLNSACTLCAGRRRNPIHVSLREVFENLGGPR